MKSKRNICKPSACRVFTFHDSPFTIHGLQCLCPPLSGLTPFNWASESIRKIAEDATFSPCFSPARTSRQPSDLHCRSSLLSAQNIRRPCLHRRPARAGVKHRIIRDCKLASKVGIVISTFVNIWGLSFPPGLGTVNLTFAVRVVTGKDRIYVVDPGMKTLCPGNSSG